MGVKFELRTPPGQKPDGSPLEPVEYVEIPVSPSEVVSRPANDTDREKYSRQYAEFKRGQEAQGTPPPEATTEEAPSPEEEARTEADTGEQLPEGGSPDALAEERAAPLEEAPRDEAPR